VQSNDVIQSSSPYYVCYVTLKNGMDAIYFLVLFCCFVATTAAQPTAETGTYEIPL